jgi:hypothetical protein
VTCVCAILAARNQAQFESVHMCGDASCDNLFDEAVQDMMAVVWLADRPLLWLNYTFGSSGIDYMRCSDICSNPPRLPQR